MIQLSLEPAELDATISALSAYRNEITAAMRSPRQSEAQREANQRSYDLVETALFRCQEAAQQAERAREVQLHLRDAKRLERV